MKLFLAIFVLLNIQPIIHSEWERSNYSPKDLFEKPGYGQTWMYIPDGNDIPQIAILKENEDDPVLQSRQTIDITKGVTFHLYTRKNPNISQKLKVGDVNLLESSNLDFNNEIKFVTHGWRSSKDSDICQIIKNNFLKFNNYNVILVDWESLSDNIIYFIPMMDTSKVGQYFAKMLDFLIECGARHELIHLIGHSLGAHVCGYAGAEMKRGKVQRITGLDPASIGFEIFSGKSGRLDPSDAIFVDIIHSCAGALGYYFALGHADFYPNGGTPSQPGCFGLPQIIEACSHGMSWKFFAESIISRNGFLATPCESWKKYKNGNCTNRIRIPMGAETKPTVRGVYYLHTSEHAPYYLH